MRTRWNKIRHYLFENRFLYLFITLLFPYVIHPLIETEEAGIALMDISFSLVLLVSVFAVSSQKHVRVVALVLMATAQFFLWSNTMVQGEAHRLLTIVTSCMCLLYTTIVLLGRILHRRDVTVNTIFASLCVYLMIGYVWAFIYSLLAIVDPGSFFINSEVFRFKMMGTHLYKELYYYMYYSISVITTLGLGDILPASPWARVFTAAEAIIGQIYLVVLVSRLVGMHITQHSVNDT